MSRTSKRDRRVTLALKWHYLDDCSVSEIQDRLEQHGHGHSAASVSPFESSMLRRARSSDVTMTDSGLFALGVAAIPLAHHIGVFGFWTGLLALGAAALIAYHHD